MSLFFIPRHKNLCNGKDSLEDPQWEAPQRRESSVGGSPAESLNFPLDFARCLEGPDLVM